MPYQRMLVCMNRHMKGDWGVVSDEERRTNDAAVRSGSRILSSYPIDPAVACCGDNTLWIITEIGSGLTTLLLPDEY